MRPVLMKFHPGTAKEALLDIQRLMSWCKGFTTALTGSDRTIYGPDGLGSLDDIIMVLKGGVEDYDACKISAEEAENARLRVWLIRMRETIAAHPVGSALAVQLQEAIGDALAGGDAPDGPGLSPPTAEAKHA